MKKSRLNIDEPNWYNDIDRTKEYQLFRGNNLIGRLVPEKSFVMRDIIDIINSNTKYFVPSYQRGYRWEKQQVKDLLDDIWKWDSKTNGIEDKKYCLQPIVLIESKDKNYDFDIVDGQQRLTTIYIILQAIGKLPKYTIEYQTRNRSCDYLKKIAKENSDENIDYYHMYQALCATQEYFNDKSCDMWYEKLTNDKSGAFFIEYNILQEIDNRSPEKIFTGLNAGKIPLTNSELVKGLILRRNNFTAELYQNEFIEIAQEWDRIEKRLREPNFWTWLGNDKTDDPHIDFILEIVAESLFKNNKLTIDKNIQNFSFHVFDYFLNEGKNISELWNKIKSCFMTLEDWYEDSTNYHLVGYLNLINKENNIGEYYYEFSKLENFSFKNKIKDTLKETLDNSFDKLSYEDKDTYKALLLFNIISCIDNRVSFHFDLFRYAKDGSKQQYDVEHIFPCSEKDRLENSSERKKWLESICSSNLFNDLKIKYSTDKKIEIADLDELSMDEISTDSDDFKNVYEKIINSGILKETKIDDVDRLGNLCLLDKTTNRGYGNKPFPNKVKEITEVDAKQERYILPCTKNVFLKYYSGLNINNYVWTKDDADKYEKKIEDTITNFFGWDGDNSEK